MRQHIVSLIQAAGAAYRPARPLMLAYLTDVRGERVVIIQVNWIG
jgi:hypothetical protein